MKTTLSLLAALTLFACASEKEQSTTELPTENAMTTDAPKAQKVSLNITGMT